MWKVGLAEVWNQPLLPFVFGVKHIPFTTVYDDTVNLLQIGNGIMSFYINPPVGNVQLANLELYCSKRLSFQLGAMHCNGNVIAMRELIEKESTVLDSECLIEGSKKDQVSHFAMRLAACQTQEMRDFFLMAELQIFRYRFSCMTKEELMTCIKPLRSLLRKIKGHFRSITDPNLKAACWLLKDITKQYRWSSLLDKYLLGPEGEFLLVPFQCVLPLVSERLVTVERGEAAVPCHKLIDVMCSLFEFLVKHGLKLCETQIASVMRDQRIRNIFNQLKATFNSTWPNAGIGETHSKYGSLKCEDVDHLVGQFPPCMAYLHSELRRKHRLRHFSRIQYILFLKELGLPVHEAVRFWRQEYSLPEESRQEATDKGGSRSHTWEREWRRYTYSIRHLYGLEGSRINYRSHCCTSLLAQGLGLGEEGGCVFKRFDTQHLTQELHRQGVASAVSSTVISAVSDGQYQLACQTVLNAKTKALGQRTLANCGQRVSYHGDTDTVTQKSIRSSFVPKMKDSEISPSTKLTNTSDDVPQQSQTSESVSQSCYDHDVCPPSQVTHHSKTIRAVDLNIHKPVDFYRSYNILLEGLQ